MLPSSSKPQQLGLERQCRKATGSEGKCSELYFLHQDTLKVKASQRLAVPMPLCSSRISSALAKGEGN